MKTPTNKGRAARGWLRWLVLLLLCGFATGAASPQHANTRSAAHWESMMHALVKLDAKAYSIGDRKVTRDEAVIYVFEKWSEAYEAERK